MLAQATILTSLASMALTLWLAFYLFARGFLNLITIRAVLSLLAISIFFLGTYNNFFTRNSDTIYLLAILLIIGMTCWYSVTFQLLSTKYQQTYRWMEVAIYLFSLTTIILLIVTKTDFVREQGNELYVTHLEKNLVNTLYGMTHIIIFAGSFFNLLVDRKIRFMAQGRFFLFTSAFPTLAVVYGICAIFLTNPPLPRVVQDFFVFSGVFMLGFSVARHQSLVERRTILQELPAAVTIMFALVSLYVFAGLKIGMQVEHLGVLIAFVIITHSLYDLGREFLERLRTKDESLFRKNLRLIENQTSSEDKLQYYLQEGLDLLCRSMNTSAGVIALQKGEEIFVVTAARNSVEVGSVLTEAPDSSGDIYRSNGLIQNIEWIASAFEGQRQIAFVGIGSSKTKLEYSAGDLDLFSEFADHVGTTVSIANLQPNTNEHITELVNESQSHVLKLESAADEMFETLSSTPETHFIKMVEDGLRKYSDFIVLGQSPLAEWVGAKGNSHIERGKQVQHILRAAIETLRPTDTRPPEPLPRTWYNYVVLHDAYIKGVMNREVMARLYISEGTFNRTRRNALRGVARWLIEENKPQTHLRRN